MGSEDVVGTSLRSIDSVAISTTARRQHEQDAKRITADTEVLKAVFTRRVLEEYFQLMGFV